MSQPSREHFAQQVIEIVRAKFPQAQVARGPQPFTLLVNGQPASLENLYRSVVLRPQHTGLYVEQWMAELLRISQSFGSKTASFDELKERIMPMLLREDSIEPPTEMVVAQPLVAGLAVGYAVDHERAIWYLPWGAFGRWKMSVDELHETALANLVNRSQAIAAHAAQDEDGRVNLILFQTMDGFDASRVLLPTLHERLRESLGSPFAAAIPNRDILLCFRNDEQTVDRLREQIANDFRRMPHPVTDRLLLITADGIAPRD